jgi:hypothetical protein
MSSFDPLFQNQSLDPLQMTATTSHVKPFRISANWKWIAKSSPREFCGPQKPASGTPTDYASVPSMD